VSNHLISAAYSRKLGSMARMAVMGLMADKASDDGTGIYASKQTMADELDTSKQTVIATIKSLVADGLLIEVGQRKSPNGFTVEYAIVVRALLGLPLVHAHRARGSSLFTGQAASPVKQVDATGQAASPHQSSSLTQTPLKPSETQGRRASAPDPTPDFDNENEEELPAGVELPAPKVTVKPHPLPKNWTPPPIDALPPQAVTLIRQWPSGAYEAVSECFRLHWLSSGRRKLNWPDAHAKWLMDDHGKVMRDAKAGVSFAALAPAAQDAIGPVDLAPTPAKARENHHSAAVHAALHEISAYRARRLACCALLIADEGDEFGLTVITPSEFQRTWLESNCRPALVSATETAIGALPAWVKFEVERVGHE
jgi:hypothetical protein